MHSIIGKRVYHTKLKFFGTVVRQSEGDFMYYEVKFDGRPGVALVRYDNLLAEDEEGYYELEKPGKAGEPSHEGNND